MAEIPRFGLDAQQGVTPGVDLSTGASQVWAQLAGASGRLADTIGRMADRAASREGELAGMRDAVAAAIPSASPFLPAPSSRQAAGGGAPNPSGAAGQVVSFFEGRGYSAAASRAIAGHLRQESNFDTGAIGDNGSAFGLAQWRLDRREALNAFAAARGREPGDFETQLAFFDHELRTSEASSGQRLIAAGDVETATEALMGFFRPAGWTPENPRGGHGFENRLGYAMELGGPPQDDPSRPASPAPQDEGRGAASPLQLLTPPGEAAPALRLRNDGTIRGEAYDRAALNIFLDRLDVSTRASMAAYADQFADDPAGLTQALDAYAAGAASQLPPQAVPIFEGTFQREKLALVRSSRDAFDRRLADDRMAAFEESLATRRTAIVRMASTAGNDAAGDKALAAELEDFTRFIQSHDDLKATARGEMVRAVKGDVFSARILGIFDKAATPEKRAEYAAAFQREWESGAVERAGADVETYQHIAGAMEKRLAADATEREKQAAALTRGVDGLMKRVKGGWDVPEGERQALKAQVEASGVPEATEAFRFFEQLADWQTMNRGQRPEAVAAQVEMVRADIRENGASERAIAVLDVMTGLQGAIETGLKEDPLAWAEQAGRIAVTPIDVSSAEGFRQSLAARAAEADAVASIYGRPKRFFRKDEVAALELQVADRPEILLDFARDLPEAFGSDTPRALAEISEDAPLVAHAVGLALSGSETIVAETAQAIGLRKIDGYEPVTLKGESRRAVVADLLGPALARKPDTEAAALAQADALFEVRARAIGLDPAADPRAAADLYGQALDDALGARLVDGVKFGGITQVNGTPTIAPGDIAADTMQDLVEGLTDDDLAALPPILPTNGVRVRAADLNDARLVAVGDGIYRVALGNPASQDPRYLLAPDGGFWTLDIRATQRLLDRRGWTAEPERGADAPMFGSPAGQLWYQNLDAGSRGPAAR